MTWLLTVLLSLSLSAASAAEWSFRGFLAGEWALERTRAGVLTRAHYSLNLTEGGSLEGSYHEDGDAGPTNEMRVRLTFDDTTGRAGSFQLAKLKVADAWSEEADGPTPAPAPEPKPVFDFAFLPLMEERFWLSESNWMGASGGKVQLVVADDSFVISQFSPAKDGKGVLVSTWAASREGAPRPRAAGAGGAKRSLWSRWWPYLGTLAALLFFRVVRQGGA